MGVFKLDLELPKELGRSLVTAGSNAVQAYRDLPWYYKAVVSLVGLPVAKALVRRARRRVPKGTILELDLHQATTLVEFTTPTAFPPKGDTMPLYDLVLTLQKAKKDPNVRGLVVYVGTGVEMPLAHLQELRDAVMDFGQSGKFTICYANSFGEGGNAMVTYYLATAFQRIVLQPGGTMGLSHLMAESPFLKNMLAKLGFEALYEHRREYKNMKNLLTETEFTEAHREATQSMLLQFEETIVAAIMESRKVSRETVVGLLESIFIGDKQALECGLIDDLKSMATMEKELEAKKKDFLLLARYTAKVGRASEPNQSPVAKLCDKLLPAKAAYWVAGGPTVALVVAAGGITVGKGAPGDGIASHTTVNILRAAAEDDMVKAIIFRVVSGGGSAVASEAIAQEVERIQTECKKPIIVSMSYLAASGGYYISALAKKIVAQPMTLTGSIGVVSGKFYTPEFWNKLGVTWDDVQAGPQANMWTGRYKYSDAQRVAVDRWLDDIYVMFKSIVARGRSLSLEEVETIAKGRVWTGQQALEHKLVDRLGGLPTAMAVVKEELGLGPDAEIGIKVFPQVSLLSMLFAGPKKNTKEVAAAVSFGPLTGVLAGVQWVGSVAPAIKQVLLSANGMEAVMSTDVPSIM